jgi:single-strand DNA-binding protein
MNSITIVGRVGKDPEVQNTRGGVRVAKFSVAVERRKGQEKVTDWFTVKAFGKTAEVVEQYATKGRLVGVTGPMINDAYERDGQKRDYWQIEASRVELLGSKEDNQAGGGGQGGGNRQAATRSGGGRSSAPADLDDEIPF